MNPNKRKVTINDSYHEERSKLLPSGKNDKKGPQVHKHIIYRDSNYIPFSDTRIIESPIFSNLWLQKLLYFNVFYSILFFFSMLTVYIYKAWAFDPNIFNILQLILIFPWAFFEVGRLYGGYYGNIKETFPDLISFELLSIIDTALLVAITICPMKVPLEYSFLILAFMFNGLELIVGVYTMTRLVRSQTALFFLRTPAQNARKDILNRQERDIELKAMRKKNDMRQLEEEHQMLQQREWDQQGQNLPQAQGPQTGPRQIGGYDYNAVGNQGY